jgi:peptidoglycan/LPS O-acetylase OafA/YrhL
MCFAFGALLAVNSEKLKVGFFPLVGLGLIYYMGRQTGYAQVLSVFFLCYLSLYLSSTKLVLRIRIHQDLSYGVYLWGWVAQQTVYSIWGHLYNGLHFLIALVLALLLSFIAHYLVEIHGINLGKKINAKIRNRFHKKLDQVHDEPVLKTDQG